MHLTVGGHGIIRMFVELQFDFRRRHCGTIDSFTKFDRRFESGISLLRPQPDNKDNTGDNMPNKTQNNNLNITGGVTIEFPPFLIGMSSVHASQHTRHRLDGNGYPVYILPLNDRRKNGNFPLKPILFIHTSSGQTPFRVCRLSRSAQFGDQNDNRTKLLLFWRTQCVIWT